MKIELTDKEVALLMGIIGITSGKGLFNFYSELMRYTFDNPDIARIGNIITEELMEMLRRNNIDEDILYNHAIRQWNKEEGLI